MHLKNSLLSDKEKEDVNRLSHGINLWLEIYESKTQMIILSQNWIIIHTKDNVKHLANYMEPLNYIIERVLGEIDITEIRYETRVTEKVKTLSDVSKNYINLKVKSKLEDEHSKFGKGRAINKIRKLVSEECSSKYVERYSKENKLSYILEEQFSITNSYNDGVGKVVINSVVYLKEGLSKNRIDITIEVLKEKQFDLLLNSFTDQHIRYLCKK